uniref:F-box domain-containing protein n=1 Tax=Schizophyllum commune (strain H4-8 / FGSC 9210) TaxID=578458 RepID=D8PXP0_SCHCM
MPTMSLASTSIFTIAVRTYAKDHQQTMRSTSVAASSHRSSAEYVVAQRWKEPAVPMTRYAPYSRNSSGSRKQTRTGVRVAYIPTINRLPVEVLSRIFMHAMGQGSDKPYAGGYFSAQMTSLVIASVCRLWRSLAVDLPFLWQRFCMRLCQDGAHYKIARLFLERTKGLGIYVQYSEDSRYACPEREGCPCALGFILQNIGQVKGLDLNHVEPSTLEPLARMLAGAAPSLIEFSVHNLENPSREVFRSLSSLCQTPTIRKIHWALPAFPDKVHWSSVTTLSLFDCPVDPHAFLHTLASAPALRSLEIEMISIESKIAMAVTPYGRDVLHLALEDLCLFGDGPQDALMWALHLPHLRHLYLDTRTDHLEDDLMDWPCQDMEVFYAFLSRLTGLREFSIYDGGDRFDGEALLEVIALPSLQRLEYLDISDIADHVPVAVIEKLEPGDGNRTPVLLPHLKTLILNDCEPTNGLIARMLLARHTYRYPLRHSNFHCTRGQFVPGPYGRWCYENPWLDTDLAVFELLKQAGWSIGCNVEDRRRETIDFAHAQISRMQS